MLQADINRALLECLAREVHSLRSLRILQKNMDVGKSVSKN